jgi:hypothetical protein
METKTLFVIEKSFNIMASSNNRVIDSQGREVAHNVWKFMSEGKLNGMMIPLKHICATVWAATGILKLGLARTSKDLK